MLKKIVQICLILFHKHNLYENNNNNVFKLKKKNILKT